MRTGSSLEPVVQPLRYLALGDSYTIGDGVRESARWPEQLAASLRESGLDMASPDYIAHTGWTTGELLAAIANASTRASYELVSVLAGVNDQYRGHDVATFTSAFRDVLDEAASLAADTPARVLVLSIPDWSTTPFAAERDRVAIAHEIDAYNRAIATTARAVGMVVVDITPASRRAALEPALIGPDGLHPTARMYARWAHLAQGPALQIVSATGDRGHRS